MNFDPAILARIQFAFTVSFHIIGLDVRQTPAPADGLAAGCRR